MAFKSTLATELKDLDVDRVDGVDRPATGRAFALFKSETGDMDMATLTEVQYAEIMKNYASVATAADMLLKALRKDAAGKVSKSTAVAVNGLAQIMGAEPVFKAVPGIASQPYEIEDPMRDENKRGPADENIGANFTPRSMPGSMVGKVQFSIKAAVPQTVAPAVHDEAMAPAAPAKPAAQAMPWDEQKMSKTIADAVAKGIEDGLSKAAPITKVVKAEDVKPVVPASKQVELDEVKIRKDSGYRFGQSFENIVFAPVAAQ
jgi:hypothetical protein